MNEVVGQEGPKVPVPDSAHVDLGNFMFLFIPWRNFPFNGVWMVIDLHTKPELCQKLRTEINSKKLLVCPFFGQLVITP